MKFGLTREQFLLIENILISIHEVEKVIIFGSRAGDTFKPSSDIDLAIIGKHITPDVISRIFSQLDDLPLPFIFDVIDLNTISSISLKNKIGSQGKLFFERQLKIV